MVSVFEYFMWEIYDYFLSKITLRILYSLTTGISMSSSFMNGSLCFFLNRKKCTYPVLLLDVLNPFEFAQCVSY